MAVAVKNSPETTPRSPPGQLALASLVGAVYVLASVVAVVYGVPRLWTALVGDSLQSLGFVDQFCKYWLLPPLAAVGLVVLGRRLAGAHPPAGLRAGVT